MEKLGKYILDYCSREQLVRWSRGTNKDSEIKWSVTSWSPYAGWTGRKEAQQSSWYTTRRTVSTVHRVLENTTCKGWKTATRFHMWVGWNSFLELTTMAVDFTVFPTGQWVSWGQGLSVLSVYVDPSKFWQKTEAGACSQVHLSYLSLHPTMLSSGPTFGQCSRRPHSFFL